MSSVSPTGSTPNSSRDPLSSCSGKQSEAKVQDVALAALGRSPDVDDRSSSSANKDLGEQLYQLQARFRVIDDTYFAKTTGDLTDQTDDLQNSLLTHLGKRVLELSSAAATAEARETNTASVLEAAVTSSIKIWQTNRGAEQDIELAKDFNNVRLGSLIDSLVRLSPKYSGLSEEVKLLLDVQDIQKRTSSKLSQQSSDSYTPNSGRSSSQTQGRRDSSDSSKSVDPSIAKRAEEFRAQFQSKADSPSNNNKAEGDSLGASKCLFALVEKAPVVVLGEGDHDEYALDSMIADPKLPEQLFKAGVRTVVAEHIYPEHLAEIWKPNCSRVIDHLSTKAFRSQAKVLNYLQFFRQCISNGIEVIPADTKEIYRPAGTDISTYGLTHRLELLNENIVNLHRQNESKGKMLIILGAAHSNNLNAAASRATMPGDNKPNYTTPGVTNIIPDAQEMIVVAKRSSGEMANRIPLSSIRDGVVFQVEV